MPETGLPALRQLPDRSTLALGTATSAFGAVEVSSGSDLISVLNANTTTTGLHEFDLLGNVVMSNPYEMDSAAHSNISIDGGGHTITKTAVQRLFYISNGLEGASLTIRNANITNTNTDGGSVSIIEVNDTSPNATIDLDGTRIYGTSTTLGAGAAIHTWGENTVVKGNVTFDSNVGATGNSSGAAIVYSAYDKASLTFEGQTTFNNNSAAYNGGAVAVGDRGAATFKEKATFTGNHADLYYGGAIQIWGASNGVTFEKDAVFTGNYVKNTQQHAYAYAVRGVAINIGYLANGASPQLLMSGTSEFTGNYVWGIGANTDAIGGAIAMSAASVNPLATDSLSINPSTVYTAIFERGIFTDNFAYSVNSNAYGGAIFSRTYNSTLTFGSGSSFTGNMAKTLGGAIYFDQGTINLNGNVTFSGNRHGVAFATSGNVVAPDAVGGSANAIYFAVSSNTATLNLNNGAGEVIHFADPIQSAASKTVTVNKTGSGTVRFTDHNSDILAQTHVSEGTFELGDGVTYGRLSAPATSNFNLDAGATLKGGAGATLRATLINLNGRLEVENGMFSLDGLYVNLLSTSVVALTIDDIANHAFINMSGRALYIIDAALEITATNYVPSQDISDTFTLVSNLSGQADGKFLQGDSITINGAEFAIHYNANSITLQQMTVPEPSTYAFILAAGMATVVWVRRQKKQRATAA